MTYEDVQELLDYTQDHIDIARNNEEEDQVIACCTRAINRLEEIRSSVARDGFTIDDLTGPSACPAKDVQESHDAAVIGATESVQRHVLARGDVNMIGGRKR